MIFDSPSRARQDMTPRWPAFSFLNCEAPSRSPQPSLRCFSACKISCAPLRDRSDGRLSYYHLIYPLRRLNTVSSSPLYARQDIYPTRISKRPRFRPSTLGTDSFDGNSLQALGGFLESQFNAFGYDIIIPCPPLPPHHQLQSHHHALSAENEGLWPSHCSYGCHHALHDGIGTTDAKFGILRQDTRSTTSKGVRGGRKAAR